MKEINEIIEAYRSIDFTKNKAALVTVVGLQGSSYRRKGARMLVTDNGEYTGGISGGCLEGDALKRARIAINKEKPSIVRYDTTQNDSHQIGVGLGCNGIIDVLFIPLDPQDKNNPVEILDTLKCSRKPEVLITINTGDFAGSTFHVVSDTSFLNAFPLREIAKDVLINSKQCLIQRSSSTITLNNTAVFIEVILPSVRLFIYGSNNDIYPMGTFAEELGWEVILVTKKDKLNSRKLKFNCRIFDINDNHVTGGDDFSAIMLMSHDYNTDLGNIRKLLSTSYFYIGILGPKNRGERLFRDLGDQYLSLTEEIRSKIFSPAGLDIGASTPEEIALSVIAEIKANFANRNGGFLKLRQGTIYRE